MFSTPVSRRRFLSVAVLLGATFLAPLAAQEKAPFRLTGVKLFPDTPEAQNGKPLEGYNFPDSQLQQHLTLIFDPAGGGKMVELQVIATRTTFGVEKPVKHFAEALIPTSGMMPVSLKLPRPWPIGSYRIEVTSGGQHVGRAGYRVVASTPRKTDVTLSKMRLYHETPAGGVEEIARPKVADRHLYFAAETKGARTDGAKVTWILNYFDFKNGTKQKVGGVDIQNWPLDDTVVTFDVALEKDWPAGRYAVEVEIDGDNIGRHDFEIAP